MQATLNMAKRLMAVSKETLPDASAISNIPFMAASSHDALASGMYQKPDIAKQVTFQDSALLSGLQKINKKFRSLDNDLYGLRAEKNEKSKRQYKLQDIPNYRKRSWSRDNSKDISRDSQDKGRRASRRYTNENRSRNTSGDGSDDTARNDSKQKSKKHCKYYNQDAHN